MGSTNCRCERSRSRRGQRWTPAGRPPAERAARRLVERAPYRESAYELLLEALAKRGNLAEATLVYDRLRTLLRDELGTAPSPAVVALHDRLLAGDAAVATAPGRPPFPAALKRVAERPFVARAEELDRLWAAFAAVRGGEGRLVLLAGEPGIGKTSVAARFAHKAHAEGATVLLGRCHAEALVPYEPFVDALRQLPETALREHAGVLARVMPELAPADVAGGDDPAARYLFFEAVTGALSAGARDGPLVLVVDDLHWAEQPTLLLLRHVARAVERTPGPGARHLSHHRGPGHRAGRDGRWPTSRASSRSSASRFAASPTRT